MFTKYDLSNNLAKATIFCGGYGSGKSEIAVNYAIAMKQLKNKVAIADLDIVNPYFRSREAKEFLEKQNVEVVIPKGKLNTADLPALPADIYRILKNPEIYAIIDVGGDDVGARVMGRFSDRIPEDTKMFLVVNPARPFQSSGEKIKILAEGIMKTSKVKINGIINNTNLLYETSNEHIEECFSIVEEAAKLMQVPIVFTAIDKNRVKDNVYPNIDTKFFSLDLQLSPEWRKK